MANVTSRMIVRDLAQKVVSPSPKGMFSAKELVYAALCLLVAASITSSVVPLAIVATLLTVIQFAVRSAVFKARTDRSNYMSERTLYDYRSNSGYHKTEEALTSRRAIRPEKADFDSPSTLEQVRKKLS